MIRACIIFLIAAFAGLSCFNNNVTKELGRNVNMPAVVLYKYGKVRAANQAVKAGTIIKGGSLVKVGKRSVCDLQIRNSRARIVLLMKANSELLLSAREYKDRTDLRFMLRKGRVSINVEKLQATEHVYVFTPSTSIRVKGTQLAVAADEKGTHIQVFSGAAEVRPRLPVLGRLPAEVRERSPFILALNRTLAGTADIVDAGRQKSPNNEALKAKLMKIPEYRAMIESHQIKALLGKELAEGESTAAALKILNGNTTRTHKIAEGIRTYEPGYNVDYPTTKINAPDIKQAKEEFLDLRGLSAGELAKSDAELDKKLKTYNKARREKLIVRMEELSGRAAQTVVLNSGRKIRGIIDTTDGDYKVYAPEGNYRFSRDQVKSLEF